VIRKPDLGTVKDPSRLLTVLLSFYEAIEAGSRSVGPSRIPVLKKGTAYTHAELRTIVGHIDGETGPRFCLVAGDETVLDGGEGAYVWDPDSTLSDDNNTVIQPVGLLRGRWRKVSF
jgi:hypothetical protein